MRWFQTGDVRATVPLRIHGGDPQRRFWPKVDKSGPIPAHRPELGPCWVYNGNSDKNGYGHFKVDGKEVMAHRFAFLLEDVIPDGLELDHLCRNTSCVRKSHLEPVTHLANMQRAYPPRARCPRGHEYSEANTFYTKTGRQRCKACARQRQVEHFERRTASPATPCLIDGCQKPARTRKMCRMHYGRWLRHGDTSYTGTRAPAGSQRGVHCGVEGCEAPSRSLGFCNRHYAKFRETGDSLAPDRQSRRGMPIRERILVRSTQTGACLIWTGRPNPNGHGRLNIQGYPTPVHRAAYEAFVGPIPAGHSVVQSCGNRLCVSPEHLLLGPKNARGPSI